MSIPLLMKLRIVENNKKKINLIFPIILIWILILPFLILALPFLILATLVTWRRGPGPLLLLAVPMLFSIMWALPGLNVRVESPSNQTHIYFK